MGSNLNNWAISRQVLGGLLWALFIVLAPFEILFLTSKPNPSRRRNRALE